MPLNLSLFDWNTPVAASSAQLRSRSTGASRSFDAPVYGPQPAPAGYVAPKPVATQPIPTTPSIPSSPGMNRMDRNANPGAGYFYDAADGWKQIGGGTDSFMAEIESMYGPALQALSEKENQARADAERVKQEAALAYDQAKTQSQERYSLVGQEYAQNRQELENTQRSALSEAIRSYNALSQNVRSRFGAGSSAGGAASELLGQEHMRREGGIRETFLEQSGQLSLQLQRLDLQQKQYEESLDQERNSALTQVESDLRNTINEINARRGEVDAAKASMRLQALQDARAKADQIATSYKLRADQIYEAIATKRAELSGNYDSLLQLAQGYDAASGFAPFATSQYDGINLSTQQKTRV